MFECLSVEFWQIFKVDFEFDFEVWFTFHFLTPTPNLSVNIPEIGQTS